MAGVLGLSLTSILTIGFLLVVGGAAAIAKDIITRDRPLYARTPFLTGLALVIVWCLLVVTILYSRDPHVVRTLTYVRFVVMHATVWVFFWFTAVYARQDSLDSSHLLFATLLTSTSVGIAVLTNPVHHLIWTPTDIVVRTNPITHVVVMTTVAGWGLWLYMYGLLLGGIVLFGMYGTHAGELAWNQVIVLLLALAIGIITNVATIVGATPYHLDFTPFGAGAFCLAVYLAFYDTDVFSTDPLAHRHVIDAITDAVIVVDTDIPMDADEDGISDWREATYTITDTNATADDWFDEPVPGKTLETVFPADEYEWLGLRLSQLDPMSNTGSTPAGQTVHQLGTHEFHGAEEDTQQVTVRAVALTLVPGADQFTKIALLFSPAG